jgi:hypothetical protein
MDGRPSRPTGTAQGEVRGLAVLLAAGLTLSACASVALAQTPGSVTAPCLSAATSKCAMRSCDAVTSSVDQYLAKSVQSAINSLYVNGTRPGWSHAGMLSGKPTCNPGAGELQTNYRGEPCGQWVPTPFSEQVRQQRSLSTVYLRGALVHALLRFQRSVLAQVASGRLLPDNACASLSPRYQELLKQFPTASDPMEASGCSSHVLAMRSQLESLFARLALCSVTASADRILFEAYYSARGQERVTRAVQSNVIAPCKALCGSACAGGYQSSQCTRCATDCGNGRFPRFFRADLLRLLP